MILDGGLDQHRIDVDADHVVPEAVQLSGDATRRLVASHLAGMHDTSPPESVHALDLEALGDPSISFWSAWIDGELAGIGALKQLDERNGELKSMRVADAFLGVEDDERATASPEVVAGGQTSLAGADDHGVDVFGSHGALPGAKRRLQRSISAEDRT